MPRIDPIPGMAYNPYGIGDQQEEQPTAGDLFGAGWRENPVVSTMRYFSHEPFPRNPDFSITEAGQDDPLYLDHFEALSRAGSQEEYDWIRSRIVQEKKDREIFAATGWGGLGVAVVSGSLSPTIFIPAFGAARGVKGAAQAFALASAAATADELVMLETNFTRTGEEVALGIASGTILGGLLGTAARYMTPLERVAAERGMARPGEQQAILYPSGDGARMASRTGYPRDELKDLTPEEIATLRMADPDGSLSAKASVNPVTPYYAPNKVAEFLIAKLGRLNPVTRTVNQPYSQVARAATLQMQDAGLKTQGNLDFLPHAEGGTIEARVKEYTAFEADFIQELDDAFARHIEGDRLPEGDLQKAGIAHVKAALRNPEGTLSHEEFNREVFRVAQTGEQHPDKNIMKAAKSWEKMAKKVSDYAEEAHEFRKAQDPLARRLFDPEGNLGPDAEKWVTHVFSPETIAQRYDEFVRDLQENATRNQAASFQKAFERFNKRRAKMEELLDAMEMDPADARAVYADNETRLQELMDTPIWDDWHEQVLLLQRQQRAAKTAGDDALAESINDDIKALRNPDNLSEDLNEIITEIKDIKSYQKVLNQTAGKLEDQAIDLAEKIEALEVQDLNALERVTNAGVMLGRKLDRISERAMDKEAKKLWKQLEAAMKKVETQKRMMERVYKGKPLEGKASFDAYNRMALLSKRRDTADAKADEIIGKIEKVETFNVKEAQDLLRAVQDLNNVRVRDLNAKRALREEKLRQKIEDISPEKQKEARDELVNTRNRMEEDFDTKWRQKGAVDLNVEKGVADFSEYGRETAEELAEKIMGLQNPIAGLEVLGGKRGPELARTLNMPLETKSKYLETDMEKIARIYIRRIAADIEMYRAFGSVNAAKVFDEVRLDFRRLRERLGNATKRPESKENYNRFVRGESLINPEEEKFIEWPQAQKEKAMGNLLRAQREVETDLRVMVKRLRHQRGVPSDPQSIAYRAGRMAQDVNVFRFMGSVVPSSLPDVARPVMRYGFRKTIGQGYKPFFTNLERVKMSRAEARRLGVALDPVLHNRAQAVFDMWDDYASRKTVPERVTGFLANKTGLVAGFDRWTAEMKQITASITMTELSAAVEGLASTGKITRKQREMLAEVGISEVLARRIWAQLDTPDGGTRIDDVMLPNTESWTDVQAKRAYAAALNKMVDDLIVTPGIDRPNWVGANAAAKVVAQFRSFMFTSTNRVLMRGAQEPDMALMNGIILSLALGALSYYTWSVSRGKGAEALDQDWEKWADEAIARAGLLGIFQEPWDIAQKIPGLAEHVTFSGEELTQRRATGLLGRVFGPSVDLAERSANVILGMSEPTQGTVHTARGLMPYQNVFYLRLLIDQLEDTLNSTLQIPERRGQ